jgi:hypothetical protein
MWRVRRARRSHAVRRARWTWLHRSVSPAPLEKLNPSLSSPGVTRRSRRRLRRDWIAGTKLVLGPRFPRTRGPGNDTRGSVGHSFPLDIGFIARFRPPHQTERIHHREHRGHRANRFPYSSSSAAPRVNFLFSVSSVLSVVQPFSHSPLDMGFIARFHRRAGRYPPQPCHRAGF